ncbi:MAG: hypothetical protein HOM14_11255 [Gammaproteobacteria bacterium]|jgi:uncharacterized protein|nr:hypothetical protein [Gammaproteobacteria bacterium]MBT3722181.1 hypothetical protein [Gammaproteobacteria bacterium]MBT4193498.1 hypothetical protein [Gammaproteobacteria bacterium]MBT4452159.1 hypothetical protein [Gammaproteobacteria bacterium]MBT4861532.1 hypothetical protein [Gammaproteobacteria bacterium]
MQGKLQQVYRVSKELGQNSLLSGSFQLSKLARLCSLILSEEADLKVTFEFSTDVYQHPSIKGHLDTELLVECQRCLEPMVHPIDLDFHLLIDATEEDVQSFQIDTVYTDEGYLDVFEVIEDELILALPLISMHEDSTCNKNWQPDSDEEMVVEKVNPFSVLEALKSK